VASESKPKTSSIPHSRTKKLRIASGALAAAGVGLLVAGIVSEMKREQTDVDISNVLSADTPDTARLNTLQSQYDQDANLRWIGLAGGALMTAAVPLMRIDVKHGVPWWSYVVGAGGAGLAVWGAIELSKNGQCELIDVDDTCLKQHDSLGRGGLALAAAAPLLSFPITHLIEWSMTKNDTKTQAYVAPSSSSITLVLRKEIRSW
jgi:hypothetical protein